MKFSLRKNREYFSCRQFDRIAELMEVNLRRANRYEFRKKYRGKAGFRGHSHMIIIEKPWFESLSPIARCAALAHELWHGRTRRKGTLGSVVLTAMPFGWMLVAGFLGIAVGYWLARPYLTGFLFIGLLALFWSYGMKLLFSHLAWPIEFESDEAAVRFFGIAATKEMLGRFKGRTPRFWPSHPPLNARLRRIESLASRYPEPVVDFEKLQHEVPQEMIPA